MLRIRLVPVAVVAAAALLLSCEAALAADRLIVGFKDGTSTSGQVADLHAAGASNVTAAAVRANDIPSIGVAEVTLPEGQGPGVAKRLLHQSNVEYVEPDHVAHLLWTPNDPRLPEQWGMAKIGAMQAWDVAKGSGVTIGVVDTGVDYTHPDLYGKVDMGWDFAGNDADPMDENGHGTHVAGIAAATADNAAGGSGVAPDARVLAVRVLGSDGSGYYSWIANGITYAADHGAKVINLSLGGSDPSETLHQAVQYAVAKGVFVTCATGNDGASAISYPAAYPECFAVGATTSADQRATFSNYGVNIDVTAPGEGILSTVRGGGYQSWSGTSMATPFVSGVGALLSGMGLKRSQIETAITSTATDLGAPGYDTTFGAGRLNAAAAVAAAGGIPLVPSDATAPTVDSVTVNTPFTVNQSHPSVRYHRIRRTRWRVIRHTKFRKRYRWATHSDSSHYRRVYQFAIRRHKVYRRIFVYHKIVKASFSSLPFRTISIAATDNVGIDRAGLAVDGAWVGTDTNGADGWSVNWQCVPGVHTFTAYAFDSSDNAATSAVTENITC